MKNNTTTILIVADDVTGAADSAARCHNAGLPATIDLALFQNEADIAAVVNQIALGGAIAFSTDSRFLPPTDAATRVSTLIAPLVAQLPVAQLQHNTTQTEDAESGDSNKIWWYKKIDSTLRGNIGSELTAMLPLITPPGLQPCAIICPAFPAQQRTLVNGYLCYAGLPPRTVHLPTLLAEQSDLPLAAIALPTVRTGGSRLQEALHNAYQAGQVLIVVDAETEEDLHELLMAIMAVVPHALCCGSAGLVGLLAQAAAIATAETAQQRFNSTTQVSPPLLAVIGSGSPMARRQIDFLRANQLATILTIDPTTPDYIETAMAQLHQSAELLEGITHKSVALCLPPPAAKDLLEGEVARRYAIALARVVQALFTTIQPATFLLVGGDTAIQTLTQLGIKRLIVQRELLPGMPLTLARDQQGGDCQIILKAGNHGNEETLADLLNFTQSA